MSSPQNSVILKCSPEQLHAEEENTLLNFKKSLILVTGEHAVAYNRRLILLDIYLKVTTKYRHILLIYSTQKFKVANVLLGDMRKHHSVI